MDRQAVRAVAVDGRAGVDQVELQRDVVPGRRVAGLELVRPARVEDVQHVDAVEPHLCSESDRWRTVCWMIRTWSM